MPFFAWRCTRPIDGKPCDRRPACRARSVMEDRDASERFLPLPGRVGSRSTNSVAVRRCWPSGNLEPWCHWTFSAWLACCWSSLCRLACSTWWRRPTSGTQPRAHGCSKPHAQARRGSGGAIAGRGSDGAGENRARFALSVCKPCDTEALHVSQQASGQHSPREPRGSRCKYPAQMLTPVPVGSPARSERIGGAVETCAFSMGTPRKH